MPPAKTGKDRSTPVAPRCSPTNGVSAVKVNNAVSTKFSASSGDTASASERSPAKTPPAPEGSSASARKQAKDTNATQAKYSPRVSQPGKAGVRALSTHTPNQSTHKRETSDTTLPVPDVVPDAVPLGVGEKTDVALVRAVEIQTRGQRENPKWFVWRQNRITASAAHRISHSLFANGRSPTPPASYMAAITGQGSHVKTRAMTWGIEKEAVAVQEYERLKSTLLGQPVRVVECGLFIDQEHPWLAASPDGIVEDKESGEQLLSLEIKCPFKHRDHTVAKACQEDRNFCLELQDVAGDKGKRYRLKPKHSYYTQVQCQMAVTGLHKVDFVVYTLRETAIVPVTFDPEFWEQTLVKLKVFYTKAVLPHIRGNRPDVPALRHEQ